MPNPPIEVSRRYIDSVREKTGMDYSNIARLAGLNPATITRPLSRNPRYNSRLSLRTLRRIAQVTGVPLPRDIEPFPATPRDELDLAVAFAEMLKVGETLTAARKAELVREFVSLVRKRS